MSKKCKLGQCNRSHKDSVVLIRAMDKVWSQKPGLTFAQAMYETIYTGSEDCSVGRMRYSYPTDVDVLMMTEALYKRDNTPAAVVDIQLTFGTPGKIRNSNYREGFLDRLKKLFKKNPKLRVVEILSPAVMGKGYFSYLTDEEALKRLV